VPGTVAGYQLLVSKPRVAIMSGIPETLEASCRSQPEEITMGWATAGAGAAWTGIWNGTWGATGDGAAGA